MTPVNKKITNSIYYPELVKVVSDGACCDLSPSRPRWIYHRRFKFTANAIFSSRSTFLCPPTGFLVVGRLEEPLWRMMGDEVLRRIHKGAPSYRCPYAWSSSDYWHLYNICNTISRNSKSGSRQTAMVGKTAVIKSTDADVTNQIA